jgi:indolepyruvate ferredoxin oxidoreductase
MPPGGVHIRWPDSALEQEARLMDYKWYAALAYVRANRLNHNVIEGPADRFGIIASGKAFNDTRQALADLGLDDDTCRRLGIRLHKVNVVWPLEATITRDFAHGPAGDPGGGGKAPGHRVPAQGGALQLARRRAPQRAGQVRRARGRLQRRRVEHAQPEPNTLLRSKADLTPAIIAKALARRLKKLGVDADTAARMDARLAVIEAKERSHGSRRRLQPGPHPLVLLSGCPHNTSTRVPEGSRALAGIGCHFMAVWMDRYTASFTQMGGEGVPWVGPGALHQRHARLRQPRRRHLLPLRAAGDAPEHRRRREHHLQDPLQRRGGDDRRPAAMDGHAAACRR